MRKTFFSFLIIFFSFTSLACAGQVDVRFGILKHVKNGTGPIIKETTTIPYLLESDGNRFGVNVDNQTANVIQYKVVLIAPKPAINEASDDGYSVTANNTRFESPTFSVQPHGKSSHGGWLSKGDPHGQWIIQVYVDGVLFKTFDVTVLPPQ